MTFVHEDDEWRQLLRIVADDVGRGIALVEKDYWVTHTLWAMLDQGFELWFKGGTSLSKGFDLIERLSEDIDVRVAAGTSGIDAPSLSWKNTKASGVSDRDAWFDRIAAALAVPGCTVERDGAGSGLKVQEAAFRVLYPQLHAAGLPGAMRPFVLLEVGQARVTPYVEVDLSSWVHDFLARSEQLTDYADNRPRGLRCIHPWVTCLEKIDAIATRFHKGRPAETFVRHYEDTAKILVARDRLPPLQPGLSALVAELAAKDRKPMPSPEDPSLTPNGSERWGEIRRAWDDIAALFWGERITLDDACAAIREFLIEQAADPTSS